VSSRLKPHSTYEVLPGGRFRPPQAVGFALSPVKFSPSMALVFGTKLFIRQMGMTPRCRKSASNTTIRAQTTTGGWLWRAASLITGTHLTGEMDIVSNAIICVTSDDGQERGYTISSWLTGNGGIEYHAWSNDYSGNLNIAGNTNTYSGPWHVFRGALLGSGINSLGVGNIITTSN